MPTDSLPTPTVSEERPWRTEGLFSPHYLTHRLPNPKSAAWPEAVEADAVFDFARERFAQEGAALKAGNEEDAEGHWIVPLLDRLGFGRNARKAIPGIPTHRLPDFLLYASQPLAQAAFLSKSFYPDCLGLLEAKRWGVNLSREGTKSKERSPQTQLRDYLSETPALFWGILTNGGQWRLVCKRDRASAFFEFDLERVLLAAQAPETEDQARQDFRLFYALFRRAAFERDADGVCLLDSVRDEARLFKAEVERRLRVQVFDCVEILARGFLDAPGNALTAADLPLIYQNCLILLYRILFVLNAEARELLPTRPRDKAAKGYCTSYGLEFVRRRLAAPDGTEYDDDQTFVLAERLKALFTLINGRPGPPGKRDKNAELNIPRYNGGLFAPDRYPFLEEKRVADSFLADALRRLAYRTDGPEQVAFDYANLGERHLGSIYEGLLEHRLTLSPEGALRLTNDKGERKTSGAYYTPEAWVAYIVSHTLQPLLDGIGPTPATSRDPSLLGKGEEGAASGAPTPLTPPSLTGKGAGGLGAPDSFAETVLRLNVCDPAMGSGHFLVEAVAFLAEAVATHPTTAPRPLLDAEGQPVVDGSGEPVCTEDAKRAYWKRRLVEACIYGVDLNPLAVELAKLSLWLETVDRVPLNFLDHHLRCGNSLLGTTLAALPTYPELRKTAKKKKDGQLSLTFSADLADAVAQAIAEFAAIEGVSTDTHGAAKQKEALWRNISETLMPRFRQAADLWLAPWFGADVGWLDFTTQFDAPDKTAALYARHEATLGPLRPFHWELEFPDIFFDDKGDRRADAGFDAVVGNPPWERIKLQENEFFAGRSPAIALAPKASDRKKLIAALPVSDPALWGAYEAARDRAEQTQGFVHRSGFFPLMGRGDTNLYAVFAEKALQLVSPTGRVGLLVPSGVATDDTTKAYFQELVTGKRLAELLDFENKAKVFEDVHAEFKFSIILITGAGVPQETVKCGFFLHGMEDMKDPERVFTLSPDDFKLFNPNTLTCPIFRRRRDVELTRKIYDGVPILIKEAEWIDKRFVPSINPWDIQFSTMFHMANDSNLFRTATALKSEGYWLGKNNVYTKAQEKYLPLYEAKMMHQYDHRYANAVESEVQTKSAQASELIEIARKADADMEAEPRYWIPLDNIVPIVAQVPKMIPEAYSTANKQVMMRAVMYWLGGYWHNRGDAANAGFALNKVFPDHKFSSGWGDAFQKWMGVMECQEDEKRFPLTEADRKTIQDYAGRDDIKGMLWALMLAHLPKWQLGFRNIVNPNNVRTFITAIIPMAGVGHSMPLITLQSASHAALLTANFNSFVLDYIARQKIGSRNATFFTVEQFAVLPPERYQDDWHGVKLADFITDRVLELCYTAHDLQGFADDLGYTGPPFAWDEEKRLHRRCQLDALYFHLYGLTRGEAGEILDTFPIVKRQDEAKYGGRFRTRDLILGYYSAYAAGNMDAQVKG